MQNVPGRLSLSWHFVYRDTQDLCLNSQLSAQSLDFSKPNSLDNSIDLDCSNEKNYVRQQNPNLQQLVVLRPGH